VDSDMATKKKTAADDTTGLDRQIGVRLAPKDYERLERLAVHLSVATIARAALLIGLDVVEAQPGVLLGEKPKKR
jgi:hypothetical protein